jgi:hypothetical protein
MTTLRRGVDLLDGVEPGVKALAAQRAAVERAMAGYLGARRGDLLALAAPPGPKGVGIGAVSASAVLATITHPARWPNVRVLHVYCGLDTHGGRALRREPGRLTRFNPHVRTALWRLARIGWQTKDPAACYWRALWDAERPGCEANHARGCANPRCSGAAHVAAMAWRRVLQRYAAEVYVGWRTLVAREAAGNRAAPDAGRGGPSEV